MRIFSALSNNPDVEVAEKRFDDQVNRVISKMGSYPPLEINFEIPATLERLHSPYISGHIEWRQFHTDGTALSTHSVWSRGSTISLHSHPGVKEYIFVITGKLILYSQGKSQVIEPSSGRKVIPGGEPHLIVALEKTHFITLYIKEDPSTGESLKNWDQAIMSLDDRIMHQFLNPN